MSSILNNHRVRRNFISEEESKKIINWLDSIEHSGNDSNYHLSEISKELKGKSCIFDISDTDITNYITKFQSVSDVSKDSLPNFIYEIIDRISKEFGLVKENIFLQAIDMNRGGKIKPHYDASVEGYINYKCNISVLSEDYNLFLDEDVLDIKERDLYGFEASLYKHWTEEFNYRRILLSFGFIIPYSDLSRTKEDPRIRMSNRIEKYFQKLNNQL